MRILLLDQFGEMGGAQRCLIDVAAGFSSRGWELHAALPRGELLGRLEPICRSVQVVPCGPFHSMRKNARDGLRLLTQLAAQARVIHTLLRRDAFDAVYVNGPRLMPAAALAHGAAPVLFHSHSVVTQPAAARLLRHSIRLCRANVIASSHFVARPIEAAASGRLRVVPNGVPSCASTRPAGRRPPIVAVLGRIAPEKGQLEFIRAARVIQRSIECRFIIAGAPLFSGGSYCSLVERQARDAKIELSGWVDDVPRLLANIDLLVVPSAQSDATPRVIAEAFSAGTPVLAFADGGVPEMIRHRDDGLLVRDRSVDGLARAILNALRSPEELGLMAERARRRWQEAYSVERFQDEISGAVQDAVERRHHRNPLASAGAMAET